MAQVRLDGKHSPSRMLGRLGFKVRIVAKYLFSLSLLVFRVLVADDEDAVLAADGLEDIGLAYSTSLNVCMCFM